MSGTQPNKHAKERTAKHASETSPVPLSDPAASGGKPAPVMPGKLPNKNAVKPILVLGVGNLLLKDEGVGIHFVQAFQQRELPPEVEAMEGGARGIDLLPLFGGRQLVIIVDCASMDEKPGTIRTFEAGEVIEKSSGFSVHGANLGTTLDLAQRLGVLPDVVVVGIEPESKAIEIGLSDTVKRAVEEAERVVRDIISSRGCSQAAGG